MSARIPASCASCGALNDVRVSTCWMCRYPFVPAGQGSATPAPPPPQTTGATVGMGWTIGASCVSLLLVAVFFELLYMWPGGAILYGVVITPIIAILLRATWPRKTGETQKAFAMVGIIVSGVLGLALLFFVSIATLFYIICKPGY